MHLPGRASSLRRQPSFGGHPARPHSALSSFPLLLLIIMLGGGIVGPLFAVVHAKDCLTRGSNAMIAWKHEGGSFQCDNCLRADAASVNSNTIPRHWTEYDKDRHAMNFFVEEHRDGNNVLVRDEIRGISVLLRSDLSGIRTEGEQNFRQLYSGAFIPVVDCT
ncbi:conserved hypothetical protein [Leishmania braziliensis MHOM/BR/75/M2904]|uniref:Uncharacterized protein n=2 Tax=Leishmania braziliensis TaxID=5660 RepID=A4HBY8_LEIBR|nr:conserved hypothetical protein [Leishmania braziliensis MHOM/BR/75/M2904]KAI5690562.1 hypothetical protein MNV84_03660 [Leishmania braziliensis]CAJ2472621.1 unnamed protein product [Leishmania braziliensis]CAJ2473047.1 unnamed protein product [Leishmania braziliensis]CAM38934.1 conserved hypothetical protein [Leishmania braziliensis MHOM/BR/75/M2904]SYZ65759.1 hypothetical_protein [Leishmania braziliensis MHOM/BR/75/M2904]